ncbi:MAG: porin [Planctomycetaceae bacterium]
MTQSGYNRATRRFGAAAPWMRRVAMFLVLVAGLASGESRAEELAGAIDAQAILDRLEAQDAEIARLRSKLADFEDFGPAAIDEESRIRGIVREQLSEEQSLMQTNAEQASAPAPADGYEVGSDLNMTAAWHNGLEIATKNKDFLFHAGGRVQFDSGWYEAENDLQFGPGGTGEFRDGVDFRRARFQINGTMYEVIDWNAEFDFVNSVLVGSAPANVPAPTDLWWTFTHLPYVGNLRVGNMKEPIGFEHLVSSRFLPFLERSFNQDAFYGPFNNGFTPGMMFFNQPLEERMTWWVGFFKPTSNPFAFNTGDAEYSATARLTFLPWYVDEGRGLLHLGVSARHADLDEGHIRFRARGSVRSGAGPQLPVLADTRVGGSDIAGDDNQMINPEVAMVVGPWSLQSDYLVSWVQDASQGAIAEVDHVFYHGGYVQVMYFLTGESQPYNTKTGVFERVVPQENFFFVKDCNGRTQHGIGAWQVGARYSRLDLNDEAMDGGILDDLTVGLNWFLNPNMKIQANYSLTHRESATRLSDGIVQAVGLRFASDF